MRARIRETIQALGEEELEAVLGAEKSARVGETRAGAGDPGRPGGCERVVSDCGSSARRAPRAGGEIDGNPGLRTRWKPDGLTSCATCRRRRRPGCAKSSRKTKNGPPASRLVARDETATLN
jgi:hypothetical protein